MTKKELAAKIAQELLANDMLDENNYSYDTVNLLDEVREIIIKNLADYVIISGIVLD